MKCQFYRNINFFSSRYYVQGADSASNVQYYADDWGFHPFIEYGNVGPHSRTRTQLLIGVEAVKALASNKVTIIKSQTIFSLLIYVF